MESTPHNRRPMIFLALICFAAYFSCYIGRSLLSPIIPAMLAATDFTSEQLGLMGSAFFLFYGLGQISSGVLGDRVKAKYMVATGVITAGILSFLFTRNKSPVGGLVIWSVCGLALSLLWAPIAKLVAENMSEGFSATCLTMLTIASVLGNFVACLIASYASMIGAWSAAFFIAGAILVFVGVLFFTCLHRMEALGQLETGGRVRTYGTRANLWAQLRQNAVGSVVVIAITAGIVRTAVSFLIPTFFVDLFGITPTASSALSGILPITNILGTLAGLYLLYKLDKNEFRAIEYMALISVAMFLLIWLQNGGSLWITAVAVFVSNAMMMSIHNLIFSKYCLRFAKTGHVATVSGILNFTSYFSAAIANTLFMRIVQTQGWHMTMLWWVAIAVGCLAASITASIAMRRKQGKYTN